MTAVRSHHYSVAESDLEEFFARRTSLIATVRETFPGFASARLIQLEDGTFSDTWSWESAEQLGAALAAIGTVPEAPLTMALLKDATALNGEVVDER